MRIVGIDPGEHMGMACVDVEQTITVQWCRTVSGVCEMAEHLILQSAVAVEWWEYQGPVRARGVAPQAAAAGAVCGALLILDYDPVRVTRGDVLSSLNLPRNAGKGAVQERIRLLTCGAAPSNDHEADAVAVAIAGASVTASRALGVQ